MVTLPKQSLIIFKSLQVFFLNVCIELNENTLCVAFSVNLPFKLDHQ